MRGREAEEGSLLHDEIVLDREMGCTRADFIRWLPGATRQASLQVDADQVCLQADRGIIEISFAQGPARTIGLVSIPVLKVRFRFLGVGTAARREFLAYFDLYTKRGGG